MNYDREIVGSTIVVPNLDYAYLSAKILDDYAIKNNIEGFYTEQPTIGSVKFHLKANDKLYVAVIFISANSDDGITLSKLCFTIAEQLIQIKTRLNAIYEKDTHGCDKIALYRELYSIAECLI